MALWKPFRGSRADLDAVPKHDGYVYFCDDGSLHFDYVDSDKNLQRKQINADTLTGYLSSTQVTHGEDSLSDVIESHILGIDEKIQEAVEAQLALRDLQVYVQSTTPDNAPIGSIWVDTSVTSPVAAEEVSF